MVISIETVDDKITLDIKNYDSVDEFTEDLADTLEREGIFLEIPIIEFCE